MKIAAANIQLQSSHRETRQFEVSERLEMWSGSQPRTDDAARTDTVTLSDASRAASETEATAEAGETTDDPRMTLLMRMIEYLTGKPVRLLKLDDLRAPDTAAASATPDTSTRTASEGFGLAYDYSASYAEHEHTQFDAEGVVRTADGTEISFRLGFSFERSYSESVSMQVRAGNARLQDPLVLDFPGPSGALGDLRFAFDLDADGRKDNVPLVGGSGFLAFDRNGNGRIDDGRELFGPSSGDGFAELAALDSDGNGWLDDNDPAFSRLSLWRPDADGGGAPLSLAEAGIGALYLGRVNTAFSLKNATNDTVGLMRASSFYLREDGSAGTVSQIDLSV